jgi:hypothetical protein
MLAVDLLLVRRSQYSLAGTCHHRRSRMLKNIFSRAGKGAENTKEKSRQWFTKIENAPWDFTPYKCTSNSRRKSPRFYEWENYRMME